MSVYPLSNQHVVIVEDRSGIGLVTSILAKQLSAVVALVSCNVEKLRQAAMT